MKLRTRLTASAVAFALSLGSVGSRADWIGDFYSSAGAGVNATAPQAIATQSAVGYSGGGLSSPTELWSGCCRLFLRARFANNGSGNCSYP